MKMNRIAILCAVATVAVCLQSVAKDDFQDLQRKLVSQHNAVFGKRNPWRFQISLGEQINFNDYLSKVAQFIGQDDQQRAQLFVWTEGTWRMTMSRLDSLFNYLRENRIQRGKTTISPLDSKVKWDNLDRDKLSVNKIFSFFPNLSEEIEKAQAVIKFAQDRAPKCYLQACKDRFKLLELHGEFLLTTLDTIEKSIMRLADFVASGNVDPKDVE